MSAQRQTVVLQASSRAYSGGPDMCLNIADGRPVIAWTMDRIAETFGDTDLVLATPTFDAGGELARLAETRGARLVCAHDDNPLARLVAATRHLPGDAVIVRVDGLHFGFFPELARLLARTAEDGGYDLVKAPDDYPIQLTVDAYRIEALRRLAATPGLSPAQRIHPKYALLERPETYACLRLADPPRPDDAELSRLRRFARQVYASPRLSVTGQACPAGDQLTFHYELALEHMQPDFVVLDAACGPGYGSRLLAKRAKLVVAVDYAAEAMALVRAQSADQPAARADVTRLGLADASFDAVVSFETIEHVDEAPYLDELSRVLKANGLLILSTPQNSLGHIPVNAQHRREYSLAELAALLRPRFAITEIIGIKQGRVVVPGDPLGQNTVVVCRKSG